ncbi:PDZ domain-containing protein [Clostridium sp.]|uniref:S1C family serine protease n=1 Tax=Clostridium sp. TaxID=1506 RepID=UPI002635984E
MGNFFKNSKKGKNLHGVNKKNYDNIVIKKDKKRFWIKRLLRLISFIVLIALVSFIAFRYYIKGLTMKEQKSNLLNEIKDGRYDITNLANKSASSLVTISDDENNLAIGKENGKNVSGSIIRTDGYIITSYIAIKDFSKIYVKISSNDISPFEAKIIGFDKDTDIAVLKIEADGLKSVSTSELEVIETGEKVATLGNTTSEEPVGFVSNGIVCAPIKKTSIVEEGNSDSKVFDLIETNSLINSENNSGILCDYNGIVIGINSLYFTNKFSKPGVYYALEINDALIIADSIIRKGEVNASVTLGITGSTVADEKSDVYGVYVEDVDKDGNAFNAGIKPTDIIVEVDDEKVKNIEGLAYLLKKYSVGNIIKLKVIRGDTIKDISVTLK